MNMGERPLLTYSEILDTPVRDLYLLRDIHEEIKIAKEKMLEEAANGGEKPGE
jgi:hypothetical protein